MVKELEKDRVNPSLKTFFIGCVSIFQQLKGRHVTDTNGYNDKVCSLEADDDDVSVFIIIYTLSSCKNNLFYDGLE